MKNILFLLITLMVTNSKAQTIVTFSDDGVLIGYRDDNSGAIIVAPKYTDAYDFFNYNSFEDFALVRVNKKWGFIDNKGVERIPLIYDETGICQEGLMSVKIAGKWGFIDKTGSTVIPLIYNHVKPFKGGFAKVIKNGALFYIDKTGQVANPVISESESIGNVKTSEAYAKAKAAGNKSFDGGFVGDVENEEVDESVGYVDEGSAESNKKTFDADANGYRKIKIDNFYGMEDVNGNRIIPMKYHSVSNFSEGMSAVSLNNKYGFCNEKGEEVIPLQYDQVLPFKDGFAKVKKGPLWLVIDKTGKEK